VFITKPALLKESEAISKPCFFLACITILTVCPSIFLSAQEFKSLVPFKAYTGNTESAVFSKNIATPVFMYHRTQTDYEVLQSDAISIGEVSRIALHFDQFGDDADYYFGKMVHCTPEWDESKAPEMLYIQSPNNFEIQNFEFSYNTKIPYIHFYWMLPRPRTSGNFLVQIFKKGQRKPVLQKRLVIYQDQLEIAGNLELQNSTEPELRRQIVQYSFSYEGINQALLPGAVKTAIKKNGDWNTYRLLENARFIDNGKQRFDFTFFDGQTAFPGGNEFRFFELGSRSGGFNVKEFFFMDDRNRAALHVDVPWAGRVYDYDWRDRNGWFITNQSQTSQFIEGDYVSVKFYLDKQAASDSKVYLNGKFLDNTKYEIAKMDYEPTLGLYSTEILVKAGIYDYNYVYDLPESNQVDFSPIDGNHMFTENRYEVFVYYKPPSERLYRVIGYWTENTNAFR
jgi:hypothetical protein